MKSFLKNNYQYGLIIASSIIAYIGFQQFYNQEGKPYTFFDVVYSAIRMFLVENDAENSKLNIFLQIARFAAPASLAAAAITGMLSLFSKTVKSKQVKQYHDHIIFSGDNENLTCLIQEQINSKNKYVLGLFKNDTTLTDKLKNTTHLFFKSFDETALKKLAFYKANYFIISHKDDLHSIELALQLSKEINFNMLTKQVEIILVFNSSEWSELTNDLKLLEETNKEILDHPKINIRYINYNDKFIRKVLLESAPDVYKPVISITQEPLQVLITDFTEIAKRLIIGLSLHCHYMNTKLLKVYVLGANHDALLSFVDSYQLSNMLDIIHLEHKRLLYFETKMDTIYLCNSNSLGLYSAIEEIRLNTYLNEANKIVCAEKLYHHGVIGKGISKVFSLKEQINTISALIDDSIDTIAKTMHVNYLKQRAKDDNISAEIDTHREWEILSDEAKDRNRYPADHIRLKVRSMGCEIVDINDARICYDVSKFEFLEELSHAEHNRWCAYMYYKGWRYNEVRNNDLKLHPDLIPYDKLSEEDKQKDRDNILQIPDLLKLQGKKIVKA